MYTTDFIPGAEAGCLAGLLRSRAARTPEAIAYRQYDAATDTWGSYSWARIEKEVALWRGALSKANLDAGDRVALMLGNSVEWVLFEQAALSLGLVVVPVYSQDNPGNAAFILGDSNSRVLLVGEKEKWHALAGHRELCPDLETVIALDQAPDAVDSINTCHIKDWLRGSTAAEPVGNAPDALATIVYTSGTTGKPKGVMLSHRNILSNAEAISGTVKLYREDVLLSFLPLSHMLERTAGYYYPILSGCEVAFARSVKTLSEDLKIIRPTVLISVPRMFERAYASIERALDGKGAIAQRLFRLAKDIGYVRFEWSQGRGPAPKLGQRLLWPILHAVVVRKILDQLGGRLRMAISGGGRLDERVAHLFLGFGLPILQGYGLTETAPIVSGNRLDNNVPDSVGPPLPGVQVRLGEDNELLVKGPGVMLGYWRRPDATEQSFDTEGWLRTGDIAEIVDGRIYIRGRIKDIIVTSTGEKVPRADLEIAIARDTLFEQVVVIGEGRPYLAALIVLQAEGWKRLAAELGADAGDASALNREPVSAAVTQRINEQLREFPVYAQIRAVYLTLEPWTIDDGLMTATLKLRRAQIIQRFEGAIDRLYAGH